MRHGRYATTFILLLALAAPTTALADSGSGETGAASEPVATKPAADTSSKPAVETSTPPATETKPPVTTTAPPVTADPVTEAPATTPATTTPATTTATDTPTESPAVPTTPDVTPSPCEGAGCIPDSPRTVAGTPGNPGGGRDLPFTGPGDVVLAIVLAMLAGTGGVLFVAGAAGREQLDALSPRGMGAPSGFKLAYRELRKQQLRD